MNRKSHLLIVDDDPANIRILGETLKDDYRISVATNGIQALERIRSADQLDLILLDVQMPDMSGHEVCQIVKADPKLADVPVIFITALSADEDEALGFDIGAVDYITKPFSPVTVKARIHTHIELKKHRTHLQYLVDERTRELQGTHYSVVGLLGLASEFRDKETGDHIGRIGRNSEALARKIGMEESECALLFRASAMHDVGKIGIPDSILLKPGRLDAEEFEVMKTHTTIGGELLSHIDCELLNLGKTIALTHHEKWNGSGYPNGIEGEKIPLAGRIVAICDVFDALTSVRPYKEAWPVDKAIEELVCGKGQSFDPYLVDAYLECLPELLESAAT